MGTLVDHLRCVCWWYFAWCAPCINTTVQERIGPRFASMAFRAARERDPESASKCKPLRTCRRPTNQPCALITLANSRPMNRPINPARYLSEHRQRAEMGSDTSTRLKRSLYVIPFCFSFPRHSTAKYLRWPVVLLHAASPAVRATSRSRRGAGRPPGFFIPGADSARSVVRRALGSRCRARPGPTAQKICADVVGDTRDDRRTSAEYVTGE